MNYRVLDLVLDGLGFPECPRWYDGHLWVSDMMTKELVRIGRDGTASVVARFEGRPGGSGFLPDGSMCVVSMEDCRVLHQKGTAFEAVADLMHLAPSWLNDMVVDGRGRMYITDTKGRRDGVVVDESGGVSTQILSLGLGEAPRLAATGLNLGNALVVTADASTLIVAETLGSRLSAFTIADDGSLSDRRVFADLGGEIPNGIALDAEGAVWVASHLGRCIRVLEGGDVVESVEVPGGPDGALAVACALGGDDRRELFITSALVASRRGPSPQELAENVLRTGRVHRVTVDVPGAGWP
jgi:sugar lactone lactonase YvrE